MIHSMKGFLSAGALCLAAATAFAGNEFNAAEQCVIDEFNEEISRYHRTVEAHVINLNLLEDKCEAETGMQIIDPRILEPDSVGVYVGGTHFTAEYTPKP